MSTQPPLRIKTVSEYHQIMGLPKPEHPLISVVRFENVKRIPPANRTTMVMDCYSIALKRNFNGKMIYGQQSYDFDEGIMLFLSPGQVFGVEVREGEALHHNGMMLLIHPDFLWNTPLAKAIKAYDFFDYSVHEALFLSEKEENTIMGIVQNIEQEYCANIDKFSQDIIIAQLELLLTYSERFYNRQFITRKVSSHQMVDKLEDILNEHFNCDTLINKGLPSVTQIADALNVSTGYLSGLLKALTGLNTQQHIHQKLIDKAKEKLSTTGLSISEIAYQLGFEHPQSFSKLFKTKTNLSPLEFRQSFN